MSKRLVKVSQFLSLVLRHQPEAIGMRLDSEGWADIALLMLAASQHGQLLDRALIEEVVRSSDKKRFAISLDGLRIRAVQGHSSVQVDIQYVEKMPPAVLFHGTAMHFIPLIDAEGLLPITRQYVHLSQDEETAQAVGARHGQPVVLNVAALRMYAQGFSFFQAENGVWLTASVPVAFIMQS